MYIENNPCHNASVIKLLYTCIQPQTHKNRTDCIICTTGIKALPDKTKKSNIKIDRSVLASEYDTVWIIHATKLTHIAYVHNVLRILNVRPIFCFYLQWRRSGVTCVDQRLYVSSFMQTVRGQQTRECKAPTAGTICRPHLSSTFCNVERGYAYICTIDETLVTLTFDADLNNVVVIWETFHLNFYLSTVCRTNSRTETAAR